MTIERPLKVYTDKSHYERKYRGALDDLLRPYWNSRTYEQNRELYGPRIDYFTLTDDIHEADFCLLPMSWLHYLDTGQVGRAQSFVNESLNASKKVVISSRGDYYVDIPYDHPSVIILQTSLHRSTRKKNEFAIPPFFPDTIKGEPTYRQKSEKARIGFCGQATTDARSIGAMAARNAYQQVQYQMNLVSRKPPPIVPPVYLRSRTLNLLEGSPQIETDFIRRKHYWAGAKKNGGSSISREAARQEYLDNIDNTDYTVCVRGTGNWSLRFFETLNRGRIPVLIDTDCVLPFDFEVDWKQYIVWVDQSELQHAGEKVADFHADLSAGGFKRLQKACRNIWQQYFAIKNFYLHYFERVIQPASPPLSST